MKKHTPAIAQDLIAATPIVVRRLQDMLLCWPCTRIGVIRSRKAERRKHRIDNQHFNGLACKSQTVAKASGPISVPSLARTEELSGLLAPHACRSGLGPQHLGRRAIGSFTGLAARWGQK
jgi:hypothetical protein